MTHLLILQQNRDGLSVAISAQAILAQGPSPMLKTLAGVHDVIILVPFFNFSFYKSHLKNMRFYIFPLEGNFD